MIESSLDHSLTQVCAANRLAAQAVAKPNAAAVGVADGFTDVHSFSTPVCTLENTRRVSSPDTHAHPIHMCIVYTRTGGRIHCRSDRCHASALLRWVYRSPLLARSIDSSAKVRNGLI